mgnify:CR=1 FL=1
MKEKNIERKYTETRFKKLLCEDGALVLHSEYNRLGFFDNDLFSKFYSQFKDKFDEELSGEWHIPGLPAFKDHIVIDWDDDGCFYAERERRMSWQIISFLNR